MGFDASKAVSSLDWTFRPHFDMRGTVPEPTDDELRTMNSKLRGAITDVGGEDFDPSDRAAAIRIFSNLSDEQVRKMTDAQIDALATVTKTSPSREQLLEVGPRLRRYFTEWLLGELNGGEG